MMFVWKDECGESESIRVVWCGLSVARTLEREYGDEKTNVIGKTPSRELDRRVT